MSLETPTTDEVREQILAGLSASLNQTIPLLPKAFNRVLANTLAGTFILTRVSRQPGSRAIGMRLSGAANTSTLDPKFQVSVILANRTFTKVKFDTVLRGGVAGWQTFDTSLELGAEGDILFVAFMVVGSKGVGAGEGSVYLDDLELTCAPLP